MCTVIVRVPDDGGEVDLLAVRDEDPARPWRPLGRWWPDRPSVAGVQDVRAGGAWLAVDASAGRLAVMLNRESPALAAGVQPVSRGMIALDAVAGEPILPTPAVRGFNLVQVDGPSVRVVTWDGRRRRESVVGPGTHMIAHHDLDDERSARIVAWRDAFARAEASTWLDVLAETAAVGPDDDRAIVRDNNAHGYPTQSLLLCTARVWPGGADVRYAAFDEPGIWNPVTPA